MTGPSEDAALWCRATCLALPGATVDQPFGPDSEVFRVRGKMFALLLHNRRLSEHMIVNLKAEPDEVPLLIEAHAIVRPGYHMNKRHWISVELAPQAETAFVEELIEDSYDNVVAHLPARLRSTLTALGGAGSTTTLLGTEPHA
ncbi:MAG TPA: MmcQ/YjbR family DNA-binding protein [Cellulomonadaceae bacterium]|nr:MmcQ/YjbR family DNA-binding protein [Cellulomonadaceae bacterium]